MSTTMNKLTVSLPSDLEIELVREFDAPQGLVFEAFTLCEHLAKWWHGPGAELALCETDLRVGGRWRRTVREADGSDHPFRGEFLDIEPPKRIVQTFVYDVDFARDFPAVETTDFSHADGKTKVHTIVRHQSKEARDGHFYSGMEEGAAQAYDQLEALLSVLKEAN